MKNWFINQSLEHPRRTVLISLILTLVLGSGLRFFKVEDDMMKLLPQNMESRKTWEKVKEEFGNTEMIFIAFGNPFLDTKAISNLLKFCIIYYFYPFCIYFFFYMV